MRWEDVAEHPRRSLIAAEEVWHGMILEHVEISTEIYWNLTKTSAMKKQAFQWIGVPHLGWKVIIPQPLTGHNR
jgi:hypothetical protein